MAKRRAITTLTERDLKNVRTALGKVGDDWEQLKRSVEGKPAPKRGRPHNEFFSDISVTKTPWEGIFCLRFKIGGAAPSVVAFVRPKAHRVKPGGPNRTWLESKAGDLPTPNEIAGEIVELILNEYKKTSQQLPADLNIRQKDSIRRGLVRKLKEAGLT
jgi:hypothetical protein